MCDMKNIFATKKLKQSVISLLLSKYIKKKSFLHEGLVRFSFNNKKKICDRISHEIFDKNSFLMINRKEKKNYGL